MMAKPEKKLVYILNYVNADDSQHYVHVLNLLSKMKELGWQIVLLSEKGGAGTQTVLGHEVRYLSRNGHWVRVMRLTAAILSLRAKGYRHVFVRISKPAALNAAIVGRLVGNKTLYWLSGTNQDLDKSQPHLKRLKNGALVGAMLRSIDYFVTGPEKMVAYFKSTLRVPEHKIMLLYNDIDLEDYAPEAKPRANDAPVQVLFVHSLSPNKEASRYFPALISRLGRIAAGAGGIILNVIGDGPERRLLERIASDSGPGLSVRFLGAVPNRKVKTHYSQADIFIMPSYREGFPRVVIEAMAMGLPIVTTDAGGTRDLVGPLQQEYVVSRDDPESFADRLAALVADNDMRQQLADENLASVQRFSTKSVARMYDEKLSALLV